MSEDGFSDSSDEPNMEIQIETLMGSSFDLRVSATDTVQDIKRRIHRVEGIPVTHQNLLFQHKELRDSRRLVDVGIKDGSKLKLVLSMRGGPISTRRISTACEHQLMLKELKELLDNTRDEIGDRLSPGSKVSVLVFKEGDIINLLRVIENEDGSYVPYSEKPISPPSRSSNRVESRTALFEKLVEDNKMMSNITTLRKKMEDATARKRRSKNKGGVEECGDSTEDLSVFLGDAIQMPDLNFKLLGNYKSNFLERIDLRIFEQKEGCKREDEKEEGNQSESEEIALKDKHRSKQIRSPRSKVSSSSSGSKSLYSESKGAHSHAKHVYARMHKKARDTKVADTETVEKIAPEEVLGGPILSPLCLKGADESIAEIDKAVAPALVEEMTVAGANRLHVARLLISENGERPKSTTDSIEVEENQSDLWSIHDSQPRQRLKSATYKLGVLKRRQSLNYGIDESSPKVPQDLGDFNYGNSSNYEVCSSSNFYHMPPFLASPSAIPPQYAPKNQEICDYYYRNRPRSPLYGRRSSKDSCASGNVSDKSCDLNKYAKLPDIKPEKASNGAALFGDYSGIQRLKNDRFETNSDLLFAENEDAIDELCSYYNIGGASDFLHDAKILDLDKTTELQEKIDLPPVIKKRARCNFCNRKLNITNIYNCRCGKIFCSQHRYSEVHHCNYDYKTDGRRFLEQQNPLVTADKINRF
ncbi:hypothetical protein HHI36_015899 [Cryptolaemus montrouzieri]|uniref:AN1-type zinc finger protein 4 n=1 Tax=Cryptolaemus montrouzieri TaxID=559131 RepID=A0ABD2N6U0_9CUCU